MIGSVSDSVFRFFGSGRVLKKPADQMAFGDGDGHAFLVKSGMAVWTAVAIVLLEQLLRPAVARVTDENLEPTTRGYRSRVTRGSLRQEFRFGLFRAG